MTKTLLTLSIGLAMLTPTASIAADDAESAAAAAAGRWLELVDGGRYAESWDESAQLFKSALSKDDWVRSLDAVRKPLGRLIERKQISKTYTEKVPGAPDGKYVIIQYQTSFENKKSAIETVTPMLDKDGRWHVSGYYIR